MNKVAYTNAAEMAPATIHLKIANDVAESMGIKISGQFLLGAIAPDAVFMRVDYNGEDIEDSHYRNFGIKKSWYEAIDEFKLSDNLFLKGYFIHIMTDVLWLSGIFANLKKKYDADFSKKILIDDMNYIEKWMNRKNEYASLWNGILGTKISNINYYVSPGEIELFKTQKSQSIKYDITAESMKYLTLEDADVFIKKSVKRILKELKPH
ncbi:MAG: zinc dependent phospholipase C family protein [Eubacteriales bacterium]